MIPSLKDLSYQSLRRIENGSLSSRTPLPRFEELKAEVERDLILLERLVSGDNVEKLKSDIGVPAATYDTYDGTMEDQERQIWGVVATLPNNFSCGTFRTPDDTKSLDEVIEAAQTTFQGGEGSVLHKLVEGLATCTSGYPLLVLYGVFRCIRSMFSKAVDLAGMRTLMTWLATTMTNFQINNKYTEYIVEKLSHLRGLFRIMATLSERFVLLVASNILNRTFIMISGYVSQKGLCKAKLYALQMLGPAAAEAKAMFQNTGKQGIEVVEWMATYLQEETIRRMEERKRRIQDENLKVVEYEANAITMLITKLQIPMMQLRAFFAAFNARDAGEQRKKMLNMYGDFVNDLSDVYRRNKDAGEKPLHFEAEDDPSEKAPALWEEIVYPPALWADMSTIESSVAPSEWNEFYNKTRSIHGEQVTALQMAFDKSYENRVGTKLKMYYSTFATIGKTCMMQVEDVVMGRLCDGEEGYRVDEVDGKRLYSYAGTWKASSYRDLSPAVVDDSVSPGSLTGRPARSPVRRQPP